MKLTIEQAADIAKRVTSQLSAWDLPIGPVRPAFVIMVALVVRELRAESKNQSQPGHTTEDKSPS